MTFEQLGLDQRILKAVHDLGFVEPTPIQQQTIPLLLSKKTDVVALAQTGTGKTAAFGLPLLSGINTESKTTQALILCPTRELCLQISNDLKNFSTGMKGLRVVSVYGGAHIGSQMKEVKQGAQIIVATPGRLEDLLDRKAVDLSEVDVVVLDEADEMLNMGFKESINFILDFTPPTKNTWLFSATMPKEVERIASKYMSEPEQISVGRRNQSAENIEHIYYVVQSKDRYAALKRIVDVHPDVFGIIFCRTKAETQDVADKLIKDGYNADALHGDLSQAQRDFVMKRYRNKSLQLLVATDVAARGIDVSDVSHVINYNLPEDPENYTHRSGRTARAGKHGQSIVLIASKETGRLREIEKIIGTKFTKKPIPNGVEICEKQLFALVHKLHHVEVNEKEIESYLPSIFEELKDLSKEEIIKRFVSEEFNRFLEYYQNAPDLNADEERPAGTKMTRFFVNLGTMDGLHWRFLKDYLADVSGIPNKELFNVDVKPSFSFFETASKNTDIFLALNKTELFFNNRKVEIEVSQGKSGGGKKEGKRDGNRGGGGKSFGGKRDGFKREGKSFDRKGEGRGFGSNDREDTKERRKAFFDSKKRGGSDRGGKKSKW